MLKTCLLILLLGPAFLQFAEGCGRTPAIKPKGEETTGATVDVDAGGDTEQHRLNCTEEEENITKCLSGGYCFVVEIGTSRELGCQCPKDYVGLRCEYRHITIGNQEEGDRVAKAGIAVSVVAVVLFVAILILVVVWRRRYLRRKKQDEKERERLQDQNGANGLTSESESSSTPKKNGSPNLELEPLNSCSNILSKDVPMGESV